ncbi:ABC transporter substrate-binding protein [Methylogaea oryzae]|uniref:Branched-chain amino acid ABC transporter substrate-binding protein n=1 Tax=Methylogaea oryzae TaxID=1295382 RepID=A0A8D4VQG5_9GAMM|nr:ABC transporter substrate-binding protein [Methylogaea oryzae]BBL72185.1 branched-chain amino acid ABC transporter substrate-binding protein [Methylogaea oryzae]
MATHPLFRKTGWLCSLALLTALEAAAAPKTKPAASPAAPTGQTLEIVYLTQEHEAPPALSNLDPVVTDKGLQGARLAIVDNNTTGQFTKQHFTLKEVRVPQDGDVASAYKQTAGNGAHHVIVDLPAAQLLTLADLPEAADDLIYNAAAPDDALRNEQCRANTLHLMPSRAMRADALAQYSHFKRWKEWFLVVGPTEEDKLLAAAYKRAAKKFGVKIVEERAWSHDYDARRTAQSEVASFTQDVDYDILVVADEAGDFGDYLSYRTSLPRPVTGTQGLVPAAWHRAHEQWGAVQLQNRFRAQAGRWMQDEDYAAWLAVRAVGEAATRAKSVEFAKVRDYLRSDAFALAGFKGKPLSFRRWDGQLRQPMLLADSRSLVAVAPLEGFLHQKNEMDTLGFDEPESKCRLR